jgi:hypothetical protein
MDNPDVVVERLFGEALDLPRERRLAFLEDTCSGQPDLRRRVEALLAENDRRSGFPSGSSWEAPTLTSEPPPSAGSIGPGSNLGRYSIIEPLGSGGMGVVYRAHDSKLDRIVAIKVLAPGVLVNATARGNFRRESLALARLNHPNIAALYDVGDQDGTDYIVMECVPGQSLRQVLQSGPLSVSQATRVVLQIAEALQEAHEQGVVHRDLKPANVILTPKGSAKVLDFGVAKLLVGADLAQSVTEAAGLVGTPLYMSPEQALGNSVDMRTDIWSLGVLYYELLTGRPPFQGDGGIAVLHAIVTERPRPVRELRPDAPEEAEAIISKAMQKEPARRYANAAEIAADLSALYVRMTAPVDVVARPAMRFWQVISAALVVVIVAAGALGWWLYHRAAQRRWAREDAAPQVEKLVEARKPLAAFQVLQRAKMYLPGDPHLQQLWNQNTQLVDVTSEPSGAEVSIQDYLTPKGPVIKLGATPLKNVLIPNGYFRWTVAKSNVGSMVTAPEASRAIDFALDRAVAAPQGMVYVPEAQWTEYVSFIGWVGPYKFPSYYMDKYEVTNRQYQDFMDHAGYESPKYWPATFQKDGKPLAWAQAMQLFRDSTGRPGPSTWSGGHYPEGKADYPVAGLSWYEATAYAAYAGKSLPVMGQWYQAADFDVAEYTAQMSNLRGGKVAAVGDYNGMGQFGTYDMAGNVREWTANPVDGDLRLILGGSWRSPDYLYSSPEALSPYDRSDTNGFRCVRNLGAMPQNAVAEVHRVIRDFATYKPVSDAVFQAYKLLYAYPNAPLNAKLEGVVKETEDWREEKVTFDTAYNGERMAAYLFLPKRVKPPYQTVLFFPSARVMFLPPDSSQLGDVNYFDYVIQSGRAVVYPVYDDTYERRTNQTLPDGGADLPIHWYKDAARTLDYLDTRSDIDRSRMAYLGVSMGSAYGEIVATLLRDRLKTVIFLDGGYFLQKAPPGMDQADFASHMKKPVLMINGRYDYTFPLETAQDPMFRMLGTPAAEKKHVVLDTPHDVSQQRSILVREVLGWLDHYLGPVDNVTQ